MSTDCLFCKISQGQFGTEFIYEDEDVVAFNDIDPKAPIHLLIIPRKHIATVNDIAEEDTLLIGKLFQAAKKIAAEKGIADPGYRLVMNCNQEGGQAVYHIHLHLLGGKAMSWPPG